MTDNRTTELLPCPFCGGEAHVKHDHRWYGDVYKAVDAYEVVCLNFDCIIYYADDVWYDTEAEAIEAWNTRAERTCHDASVDSSTQFYCSECECTVDVPLLWGEINYCPECGAKVVGE